MRNRYTIIVLSLFAVLTFSMAISGPHGHSINGEKKSAGPPACHAGEPPLNTTCRTSGCHSDFALNSGPAILDLDLGGAESGYALGSTYTVRVSLTRPGLMRGGFQFVALTDDDISVSPGTYILTDPLRTQRIDIDNPHAHAGCDIANKVWIEHTEDGIDDVNAGTVEWEFDWEAPLADVGNITFYVAAVDANVDFDNTGDHVYATTRNSSWIFTSVNERSGQGKIRIHPNPASDVIYIRTDQGTNAVQGDHVVITDLHGKVVLTSPLAPFVPITGLQAGKYTATIEVDGKFLSAPFVKL
jgi:hypothetical protein